MFWEDESCNHDCEKGEPNEDIIDKSESWNLKWIGPPLELACHEFGEVDE